MPLSPAQGQHSLQTELEDRQCYKEKSYHDEQTNKKEEEEEERREGGEKGRRGRKKRKFSCMWKAEDNFKFRFHPPCIPQLPLLPPPLPCPTRSLSRA